MPIQDVGTIGSWTPSRLTRFIQTELNQRNQIGKTSVSTDASYVHGSLTFTSGDFQTADTIITRPQSGILWLNGSPILTASNGGANGFAQLAPYSARQTFGGVVSVGGPTSTSPGGSNGVYIEPSAGYVLSTTTVAGTAFLASSINGDTNWRFWTDHNGLIQWGPGGATALDTNLFRNAANVLRTNGQFIADNGLETVQAINSSTLANFYTGSDSQPAFKIFAQGAMTWGAGGSTAADIELARIVNGSTGTGSFLEVINGDGLGYGTGTGGTVTQGTSLSTGVTLNKPTGTITLFTSSITAGLLSSFTVTNSVVGANDTVVLSGQQCTGLLLTVSSVSAGAFQISHYAPASLSSSTRKINFTVIKGATA